MATAVKEQTSNQTGNFISDCCCIHQPRAVPPPMIAKSWKDKPMYLTQVGTCGLFELGLD